MFRFHDVPAGCPAAAGLHAGSLDAAKYDIEWQWRHLTNCFPQSGLSTPRFLKGGTTRLSRALFIDSRRRMPLSACTSLLEPYLALQSGQLESRQYVGQLPQHHRRIAAELVSTAASISAAQRCGYQFFADRHDLNVLIKNCWVKPWDGKGPDLLMSGPKGTAFLEIKGSTRPNNLNLGSFASHKAQSVNAELRPFGSRVPTRHLLSVVFAPHCQGLSVHWFNAEERHGTDFPPQTQAILLIATGLAQFVGQVRNAGYDASDLLKGEFPLPVVARRGHGFLLAPEPDGDSLIGVSYAALRLFVDISRLLLRLRARGAGFERDQGHRAIRLAKRLTHLRSVFGTRDSAWPQLGPRPIYTYSTGIFVLGPRHRFG
ncbi:hypothetical protein B7759_03082 [Burkholderia glumae]|uniref:hypothetical protein n=1 Tax=Burkholderia glumae TaxID=337 RepID=UPI001AEA8656|nr:hypothetical protein [Burkholderia glumae]QTP34473.1 hypothetical protein B7759_03082 [Burkholderia glumae]